MTSVEALYRPILIKFMRHINRVEYPLDHSFDQGELANVTPEQVVQYFTFKAYGVNNPTPNMLPLKFRSSTFYMWKKAISFFMPNKHMQWNELSRQGNPTMSQAVNAFIKKIQKLECRGLAKESKVTRPFVDDEFIFIINSIEKSHQLMPYKKYFTSAYFRYQVSMIARVDDVAHLEISHIQSCPRAPEWAIMTKLNWSKNVRTEDDCPFQIILGAMDARFCALIGLAIWLEYSLENAHVERFAFEIDGQRNPDNIKYRASKYLRNLIESDEYQRIVDDILTVSDKKTGTHSLRKFATTKARESGCTKDDVDYRARWRNNRRQQDTYAPGQLLLPDAKVCAALCRDGPIGYKAKEDSGISNDWILSYVCPAISRMLPRPVALILGKALLWKIFEDKDNYLPSEITRRVKGAWHNIPNSSSHGLEYNPISKVPLAVYGTNGQVVIEELMYDVLDNNNRSTIDNHLPISAARTGVEEHLQFLNSQLLSLRRELHNAEVERLRQERVSKDFMQKINRNLTRVLSQPGNAVNPIARINVGMEVENDPTTDMATLSRCPKTCHALWREYQYGIGNNKPAKEFTSAERGRNKYNYNRRKYVWDIVSELVRAGVSADVACDRIHNVYGGNSSVTTIINRIRKDKIMNTLHPSLRA